MRVNVVVCELPRRNLAPAWIISQCSCLEVGLIDPVGEVICSGFLVGGGYRASV